MSDGGIGGGLSYWATINVKGSLTKEQLKAVTKAVRKILSSRVTEGAHPEINNDDGDPIDGIIVQAGRVANTGDPMVSVNINPVKPKTS